MSDSFARAPLPHYSTQRWFWIAIGIVVAVRIVAVVFYPTTGFPDRFGYLTYADRILTDPTWLDSIAVEPLPTTAFRAAGFPLVIVFLKTLFGDGFATVLQALQTAAAALACIPLFAALYQLTRRGWMAGLSVIGFGTSVGLAYELSILPDAFLIAGWVALLSIGVRAWMENTLPSAKSVFLMGLIGVYIVMARGNGLHLLVLTGPVILLALLHSVRSRPSMAALVLATIYLPGVIAYGGVSAWNEYRTGERFFTTGAQIALVQPVFRMWRLGAEPFDGDDVLSQTVRQHAPEILYEQIYDVNAALRNEHNWTAKQIADANVARYIQTVIENPTIFLEMMIRNFDDKFAIGLINPAFGLHEAHRLVLGERLVPGFSRILRDGEGGAQAIPYAVVYAVGMVISVIVFLSAVIVAPLRAGITLLNRPSREAWAVLALWTACMAVILYYSALFLVLRYVIMTAPFLIGIGLWALRRRSSRGALS